jgi:Protein of unknown function (DUF2752)
MGSTAARRTLGRVGWSPVDHYGRQSTWLAAGGLLVGAVLAVTGPIPIGLHGPLHYLGIMDPVCGMTRGVVWTLRGHLGRAWTYNPASPLLVVGAVAVLVRAAIGWRTGRWLTVTVRDGWLLRVVAVVAVLALWANQQHHAALLVAR